MKIYVITAFGPMIDTICEVFKTRKEAEQELQWKWNEMGITEQETICTDIWKTDDYNHQNIEWQIHEKEI